MASSRNLTRRHFLATGAATLAVPTILPRSVFGANEAIVAGFIGVANQGTPNLKNFVAKGAKVGAVCDVDRKHLAAAVKLAEDQGSRAEAFGDYRKLLDRKDIDVVVVTTPDHWHALPTIHACEAGKDVYCEKPLSLTVVEGRKMVEAARKNDRIVQTGSQQRSSRNFQEAVALVRSGKIGKVQDDPDRHPARSTSRARSSPTRPRPPSSTMTSGSARRRSGRTTRSTSITTSASSGTTPAAR